MWFYMVSYGLIGMIMWIILRYDWIRYTVSSGYVKIVIEHGHFIDFIVGFPSKTFSIIIFNCLRVTRSKSILSTSTFGLLKPFWISSVGMQNLPSL